MSHFLTVTLGCHCLSALMSRANCLWIQVRFVCVWIQSPMLGGGLFSVEAQYCFSSLNYGHFSRELAGLIPKMDHRGLSGCSSVFSESYNNLCCQKCQPHKYLQYHSPHSHASIFKFLWCAVTQCKNSNIGNEGVAVIENWMVLSFVCCYEKDALELN